MSSANHLTRFRVQATRHAQRTFPVACGLLLLLASCAPAGPSRSNTSPTPLSGAAPSPDPRIGLRAGMHDAAEASWNVRVLSRTRPSEKFADATSSDLAFTRNYAIQGSYNGFQVWDITTPSQPTLAIGYFCPASQSDVSVYRNLLFISGEGNGGRLDCGAQGVRETVSKDRLRGIRIFDITDIKAPRYIGNVQTCRGSHTHTVLEDPKDKFNVYIYVSGSAGVRSPSELPGCFDDEPSKNPNSALFRIEVIKVPLDHPEQAAVVSSPRIFTALTRPIEHAEAPEEVAEAAREAAAARARGLFTATVFGMERVLPVQMTRTWLDSIVAKRGGSGMPLAADSAALRAGIPALIAKMIGEEPASSGPRPGPTQCHDITVYPAIGLAGGACEGYGLLLDIRNPENPVRIDAVADSNFSYWHSATFSNDGSKVLFTDEWGGGGQPKCRATDRKEWGANAIFTIVAGRMQFQSYYKLPAAQANNEVCVAHNGSLIPIPGRDVMVQSWYEGGISIFDWTDAKNPREIAYWDRGPSSATELAGAGTWSVYWYNGVMVSSEISRGLDILELTASAHLSQNEIDAAKTVKFQELNAQGQPKLVWPPSFALARAYVDQLERSGGLSAPRVNEVRTILGAAEREPAGKRAIALGLLAAQLSSEATQSSDATKARLLANAVTDLAR
jgi:hypothetical protein